MKKIALFFAALLLATSCFAQVQQWPITGQYGLAPFKINNQLVASRFDYRLDSIGSTATFTWPFSCTMSLGAGQYFNPFSVNNTVTITDIVSANTETVAQGAPTSTGSTCTIVPTALNSHSSFTVSSGTCGLKEALNYLQTTPGVILVTQEFYDHGCTSATITGVNLTGVQNNQFIHDISNGQDTWYALKPTNNTLIAAPAAPVIALVTGGAMATGAYLASQKCIDRIGGQTLSSADSNTVSTTGATLALTFTPATCAAGSVGYIPQITLHDGAGSSEVDVVVTSAVCTVTTLENVIPACALGAVATITANPGSGSKQLVEAFAHTAFAFEPINGSPVQSGLSTAGSFQTDFLPFVVGGTLSSSNQDLATWYIPAGFFNGGIGRTWEICFKEANATQVASGVNTYALTASTLYGQTVRTLASALMPTQTSVATVVVTSGCFSITTAAIGASGTFWGSTPGGVFQTLTAGATVVGNDTSAVVSGTLDLTKGMYMNINLAEGAGHNVTAPIIDQVVIKPVLGT